MIRPLVLSCWATGRKQRVACSRSEYFITGEIN